LVFQTKEEKTVMQMYVNGQLKASSENLEFSDFEGCTNDAAIKLANDDESHPFIGFLS